MRSDAGAGPGTRRRPDVQQGRRLTAGSTLVFQMHYTPTGEATMDRTSIGLLFAKATPKTELRVMALINGSLHIASPAST